MLCMKRGGKSATMQGEEVVTCQTIYTYICRKKHEINEGGGGGRGEEDSSQLDLPRPNDPNIIYSLLIKARESEQR